MHLIHIACMKIPIQLHTQCPHPIASLLAHSQYWLWIKEAFWQEELPHRKWTPAFVDTASLWSSFPWQPVQCKRDFVLINVCCVFFFIHLARRKLLHLHLNSFGCGEESRVWARNWEMDRFWRDGTVCSFHLFLQQREKEYICWGKKKSKLAFVFIS